MSHLEEIIDRVGGVAPVAQLYALGAAPVEVDNAVRRGRLVRVRSGWVAAPQAPREVVRAVAVGGRLSCVSVLEREKIWCVRDHRLHVRVAADGRGVTSPNSRKVPLGRPEQHGLVVHRSRRSMVLDELQGAVDGFEWALLHAVECQSRMDAIVSLDSALHEGRITTTGLQFLLSGLPKSIRAYLDVVDPAAASGLETKARLGLRRMNIPFRSQVKIDGVGAVDLLIGDRLVLETDGEAWHSGAEAYAVDRERDLALVERGYIVIRLTFDQVMLEWPRVIAAVRALVARREHRWAARHRRAGLVIAM